MLTFRKAKPEDIDEVHNIYVNAAKYKHRYDDHVWKDGFSRDFVIRSIKAENILCAISDKYRIACVFSLEWEDEIWVDQNEASAGYLHRLAVADSYHGKKIGKQAIEWAQNSVKNSGKLYLRLDCPTDNKNLCKYYESLGFKLVKTIQLPQFETLTSLYQTTVI